MLFNPAVVQLGMGQLATRWLCAVRPDSRVLSDAGQSDPPCAKPLNPLDFLFGRAFPLLSKKSMVLRMISDERASG
jgi:hypothetical protein